MHRNLDFINYMSELECVLIESVIWSNLVWFSGLMFGKPFRKPQDSAISSAFLRRYNAKYLWIRLALFDKQLAKIIDYLVQNSTYVLIIYSFIKFLIPLVILACYRCFVYFFFNNLCWNNKQECHQLKLRKVQIFFAAFILFTYRSYHDYLLVSFVRWLIYYLIYSWLPYTCIRMYKSISYISRG